MPTCTAFGVYPHLWHHLIIHGLIDRHVGERFDLEQAARSLGFDDEPGTRLATALEAYLLLLLASEGLLAQQGETFLVVRDIDA